MEMGAVLLRLVCLPLLVMTTLAASETRTKCVDKLWGKFDNDPEIACESGRIALTKLDTYSLRPNSSCRSLDGVVIKCRHRSYAQTTRMAQRKCNGLAACRVKIPRKLCGKSPGYVIIRYSCVPEKIEREFCDDFTSTAFRVSLKSPQYPKPIPAGPHECKCTLQSDGVFYGQFSVAFIGGEECGEQALNGSGHLSTVPKSQVYTCVQANDTQRFSELNLTLTSDLSQDGGRFNMSFDGFTNASRIVVQPFNTTVTVQCRNLNNIGGTTTVPSNNTLGNNTMTTGEAGTEEGLSGPLLGAVIGGAAAFVVLLILLIVLYLRCRKRSGSFKSFNKRHNANMQQETEYAEATEPLDSRYLTMEAPKTRPESAKYEDMDTAPNHSDIVYQNVPTEDNAPVAVKNNGSVQFKKTRKKPTIKPKPCVKPPIKPKPKFYKKNADDKRPADQPRWYLRKKSEPKVGADMKQRVSDVVYDDVVPPSSRPVVLNFKSGASGNGQNANEEHYIIPGQDMYEQLSRDKNTYQDPDVYTGLYAS